MAAITRNTTILQSHTTPYFLYKPAGGTEETLKHRIVAAYVSGNCMEKAGIHNGDIVVVDTGRKPKPALCRSKNGVNRYDICLCRINGVEMIKRYERKVQGVHTVSTLYKGVTMQRYFSVGDEDILGVVTACFSPEGRLRWELDGKAEKSNRLSGVDSDGSNIISGSFC